MKGLILKDIMCLRKQLTVFCYVIIGVLIVSVMFVLSTRFGNLASGASEMLGDSEYGLITENSEEGIYRGMKKMLSEPGYYEYIRSRARLRMDWLSEDRITDKLEDCFERLLRTE